MIHSRCSDTSWIYVLDTLLKKVEEVTDINEVFADLKQKGLIRKRVRLMEDRRMPSAKASLFKGSIRINPDYSVLPDDCIRFILLHEEGHMVLPQRTLAILVAIALTMLPVAVILSMNFSRTSASAMGLMISVLTIILVFRLTTGIRHKDEHQSDVYAAKALRDKFDIQMPSTVAESCFSLVLQNDGHRFLELVSGVLDTHPDIEARMEVLRHQVDTV